MAAFFKRSCLEKYPIKISQFLSICTNFFYDYTDIPNKLGEDIMRFKMNLQNILAWVLLSSVVFFSACSKKKSSQNLRVSTQPDGGLENVEQPVDDNTIVTPEASDSLATQVKLKNLPPSVSPELFFKGEIVNNPVFDGYAYMLGEAASLDCHNEKNYSETKKFTQTLDIDVSFLSEGEIKLCLIGVKNGERILKSIFSYKWIKDTHPPILKVTPSTITTNQPFLVNAAANEEISLSWKKLTGPGVISFSEESPNNVKISANKFGSYTAEFEAIDRAGNKTSSQISFYWGKAGPIISIDVNHFAHTEYLLMPTIDDAESFSWQVLSGPGAVILSAPLSQNTTFTADHEGIYKLRLTATNATGNSSSLEVSVTWDTTAPALLQVGQINDAVDGIISNFEFTHSSLPIIAKPGINETATIKYKLVPTGTLCDASLTYKIGIPATNDPDFEADGTYNICLEIKDLADNIAYAQTPGIILDRTPPPGLTVEGVPSNPSIEVNFSLSVLGDEVHFFKYNMGNSASVDCDDEGSYLGPIPAKNAFAMDISTLLNQEITLCLIGGDLVENFMPTAAAYKVTWTNDSLGPLTPNGFAGVAYTDGGRIKWLKSDPDAASFLLIRRAEQAVSFVPSPGISYEQGLLPDGEHFVVSHTLKNEIYDDHLSSGTHYFYALFAHDTLYNYSPSAEIEITPLASNQFNFTRGFNGAVRVIKQSTYNSGSLYFGGDFSLYDHNFAQRIIRFFPDYSLDSSFSSGQGFNSSVMDLAEDSSGTIYVGGSFTNYNGAAAARIVSINSDGSRNTNFVVGSGFNGTVNAVALDPSTGDLYVGGAFTIYNGTNSARIIRLNNDGSVDTLFDVGAGFNNSIFSLAFDAAQKKLYIGGQFTTYKGIAASRIICLTESGDIDSNFSYGGGTNNTVYTMLLDDIDNKLYVGGQFTSYQSIAASRIMRLNYDGSLDSNFYYGSGFNNIVRTLNFGATHAELYIGGNFTTYNGLTHRYAAKLFSDGSEDASYQTGIGFENTPLAGAYTSQGEVLWGGSFVSYQNSGQNFALATDVSGGRLNYFSEGSGFNSTVYQILSPNLDREIYAFGAFTMYDGKAANRLIKLDANGKADPSFNIGSGLNNIAYAATFNAQQQTLYIGGAFTSFSGTAANRLIALNTNGTIEANFFLDSGFNNIILSLAFDENNAQLYVGGRFTTYKGSTASKIVRLNTNGDMDPTFLTGAGFNNDVWALLPLSGGDILVAGAFTEYDGQNVGRIIRLKNDGSLDTNFSVGSGANGTIYALSQDEEGIWLGGAFTSFNGATYNRLTKISLSGDFIPDLNLENGFNNSVLALALDPFNKDVYVGGQFSTFKGNSQIRFVRLTAHGEKNSDFDIGTGFNSDLRSILADEKTVYVSGAFSGFNDKISSPLIKILPMGNRE